MTDKEPSQPSLTEQVASNAAAFASNMHSTWERVSNETVARATAEFAKQYAAYLIRQVEAGKVSFMDTDLPDMENNRND